MAQIAAITIPDADLSDVLEALEGVWKQDVVGQIGQTAYDALPDRQKVRALLMAVIKTRTRNVRRERAERAIAIVEVDTT